MKIRLSPFSCYLACDSNGSNNHEQWNHDMYTMMTEEICVLRSRGFGIVALGDFNVKVGKIPGLEKNHPQLNRNTPVSQHLLRILI